MIPLGILASSMRRATSSELLAPTNLIATLIKPIPLPTVIGEPYGGGFFAGEFRYPNGQWFKLIIAPVSADVYGLQWKTSGSITPQSDSITDGLSNTLAMLAAGANVHPAGDYCNAYRGGGSADWYMPAKDELNAIYLNLGFNRPGCPESFRVGGGQEFHASQYYLSSTQDPATSTWIQVFSNGYQNYNSEVNKTRRVRPVRRIAFTPD